MVSNPSCSSFRTTIGVDALTVFCDLDGVVAVLSCIGFTLPGAWTCCSSDVGALLTVALVLGVVLGA